MQCIHYLLSSRIYEGSLYNKQIPSKEGNNYSHITHQKHKLQIHPPQKMYQTYRFPATEKVKTTKGFQPVLPSLVQANNKVISPKRERPLVLKQQGTLDLMNGNIDLCQKHQRESSPDLPQRLPQHNMDVIINTTSFSPVTCEATTSKAMTKLIRRPQSYKKNELVGGSNARQNLKTIARVQSVESTAQKSENMQRMVTLEEINQSDQQQFGGGSRSSSQQNTRQKWNSKGTQAAGGLLDKFLAINKNNSGKSSPALQQQLQQQIISLDQSSSTLPKQSNNDTQVLLKGGIIYPPNKQEPSEKPKADKDQIRQFVKTATSPIQTYLPDLDNQNHLQSDQAKIEMSFAVDEPSFHQTPGYSTQNMIQSKEIEVDRGINPSKQDYKAPHVQQGYGPPKEHEQSKEVEVLCDQTDSESRKNDEIDQNGQIQRENRDLIPLNERMSNEAYVIPDIELLNFEMGSDEHQIKNKRFKKAAETTKRELKLAQVKFRTSESNEMLQAEAFGNFTGKKLNTFKRESLNSAATNVRNVDNLKSYQSLPGFDSRNLTKKDRFSSKLLETMQVKSIKNANNPKGMQRVKTAKVIAKNLGRYGSKDEHKTTLQTLGIKIDDKQVSILSKQALSERQEARKQNAKNSTTQAETAIKQTLFSAQSKSVAFPHLTEGSTCAFDKTTMVSGSSKYLRQPLFSPQVQKMQKSMVLSPPSEAKQSQQILRNKRNNSEVILDPKTQKKLAKVKNQLMMMQNFSLLSSIRSKRMSQKELTLTGQQQKLAQAQSMRNLGKPLLKGQKSLQNGIKSAKTIKLGTVKYKRVVFKSNQKKIEEQQRANSSPNVKELEFSKESSDEQDYQPIDLKIGETQKTLQAKLSNDKEFSEQKFLDQQIQKTDQQKRRQLRKSNTPMLIDFSRRSLKELANKEKSPKQSPKNKFIDKSYGTLSQMKIKSEELLHHITSASDVQVQNFLHLNASFLLASINDKLLMKSLKSVDLVRSRNQLLKQSREYPDDVCLLHNKAILMAFEGILPQSDELFQQVHELNKVQNFILDQSWIQNWFIVKLRMGDYKGINLLHEEFQGYQFSPFISQCINLAQDKELQIREFDQEETKLSDDDEVEIELENLKGEKVTKQVKQDKLKIIKKNQNGKLSLQESLGTFGSFQGPIMMPQDSKNDKDAQNIQKTSKRAELQETFRKQDRESPNGVKIRPNQGQEQENLFSFQKSSAKEMVSPEFRNELKAIQKNKFLKSSINTPNRIKDLNQLSSQNVKQLMPSARNMKQQDQSGQKNVKNFAAIEDEILQIEPMITNTGGGKRNKRNTFVRSKTFTGSETDSIKFTDHSLNKIDPSPPKKKKTQDKRFINFDSKDSSDLINPAYKTINEPNNRLKQQMMPHKFESSVSNIYQVPHSPRKSVQPIPKEHSVTSEDELAISGTQKSISDVKSPKSAQNQQDKQGNGQNTLTGGQAPLHIFDGGSPTSQKTTSSNQAIKLGLLQNKSLEVVQEQHDQHSDSRSLQTSKGIINLSAENKKTAIKFSKQVEQPIVEIGSIEEPKTFTNASRQKTLVFGTTIAQSLHKRSATTKHANSITHLSKSKTEEESKEREEEFGLDNLAFIMRKHRERKNSEEKSEKILDQAPEFDHIKRYSQETLTSQESSSTSQTNEASKSSIKKAQTIELANTNPIQSSEAVKNDVIFSSIKQNPSKKESRKFVRVQSESDAGLKLRFGQKASAQTQNLGDSQDHQQPAQEAKSRNSLQHQGTLALLSDRARKPRNTVNLEKKKTIIKEFVTRMGGQAKADEEDSDYSQKGANAISPQRNDQLKKDEQTLKKIISYRKTLLDEMNATQNEEKNTIHQKYQFSRQLDKIFDDIGVFIDEIGGKKELLEFLEKYAKEWKSGEIYAKGKGGKEADKPWRITSARVQKKAYELVENEYSQFKETIAFLIDNYMKNKKKLLKHLDKMEKQTETEFPNSNSLSHPDKDSLSKISLQLKGRSQVDLEGHKKGKINENLLKMKIGQQSLSNRNLLQKQTLSVTSREKVGLMNQTVDELNNQLTYNVTNSRSIDGPTPPNLKFEESQVTESVIQNKLIKKVPELLLNEDSSASPVHEKVMQRSNESKDLIVSGRNLHVFSSFVKQQNNTAQPQMEQSQSHFNQQSILANKESILENLDLNTSKRSINVATLSSQSFSKSSQGQLVKDFKHQQMQQSTSNEDDFVSSSSLSENGEINLSNQNPQKFMRMLTLESQEEFLMQQNKIKYGGNGQAYPYELEENVFDQEKLDIDLKTQRRLRKLIKKGQIPRFFPEKPMHSILKIVPSEWRRAKYVQAKLEKTQNKVKINKTDVQNSAGNKLHQTQKVSQNRHKPLKKRKNLDKILAEVDSFERQPTLTEMVELARQDLIDEAKSKSSPLVATRLIFDIQQRKKDEQIRKDKLAKLKAQMNGGSIQEEECVSAASDEMEAFVESSFHQSEAAASYNQSEYWEQERGKVQSGDGHVETEDLFGQRFADELNEVQARYMAIVEEYEKQPTTFLEKAMTYHYV